MKDPAFLFYDGDAARDVSHMNRLERGCYFDFIQAQRKFHGITTEQARKILGNDFDTCWEALEMVLTKDSDEKYYIQWVRDSIFKSAQNSKIQRERIQKYWDDKKKNENKNKPLKKIPRNNHGNTVVLPIETDTDNIKNKEGCGEKKEKAIPDPELEKLYNQVVDYFPEDTRPKTEKQKEEWIDTLDKLIRIDKKNPEDICRIVELTRKHDFWKKNFLSLLKLRKKNGEQVMYYTVFEQSTQQNGRDQQSDERRIKRVNQLWNQ